MSYFDWRRNRVSEMAGVNLDMLADYLKTKMEIRDISLRRAAGQMDLSPATLSRLLLGSGSKTSPDTSSLEKAAEWLNRSLTDFDSSNTPKETTLEQVEVHLRALEGVSEQTAAMMIAAVRSLYRLEENESTGRSS